METVGSFQAKTHLPALLERVAKGERITITRHGVPIAMLVPVEERTKPDVEAVINEFLEFRANHTLGEGVTIKDLINEGRSY